MSGTIPSATGRRPRRGESTPDSRILIESERPDGDGAPTPTVRAVPARSTRIGECRNAARTASIPGIVEPSGRPVTGAFRSFVRTPNSSRNN